MFRTSIKRPEKEVLAQSVKLLPTPTIAISPTPTLSQNRLSEVVMNELKGSTASYSAVIKNFKTGEIFYLNEHIKFTTASLYKLWVMGRTFELIKNGDLSLNDQLSGDVATLNKKFQISTEAAELKEGKLSMDISKALTRMITVSDNYSALLLTQKIKLSSIKTYLNEKGFFESDMGPKIQLPRSTAYDIALFFEKLYLGELENQEYTDKMLELLKDQKINRKIPRFLPDDIEIAHKTGELDNVSHDAGIVYSKNGDYLIVLMSKSNNPSQAEQRLANISEAVYKFFNSE